VADREAAGSLRAPNGRVATLLLAASLSLPFPAAGVGARGLCDRIARYAATELWAGAAFVVPAAASEPEVGGPLVGIGDPAMVSLPWATDGGGSDAAGEAPADAKPAPPRSTRRGILVREATVRRAVASGMRPTGVPVSASYMRPAGLALQGIGAFGAGLADGDVLTSVGGTSATSVGAVVGAVSGAVRSGARALGAVVWRGDRRIDVTVELPRVEPSRR
jgi:hypothetical protein